MPTTSAAHSTQIAQLIRGALLIKEDPVTTYRPISGNLRDRMEAAKHNIIVSRRIARQTELQMFYQLGAILVPAEATNRAYNVQSARTGARLDRKTVLIARRVYSIFKHLPEYISRTGGVSVHQFAALKIDDYIDILEDFEEFYRQRQAELSQPDLILFDDEMDNGDDEQDELALEDYPNDYPDFDGHFGDED
jgi:hypothetical protein